MNKIKVLRSVFVVIGLVAFFAALGVAGASDYESEMGKQLHSTSWYFVSAVKVAVGLLVAYFGVKFTELLDNMSGKNLRQLEQRWGKKDWFVRVYRGLYRFFKA